MISKEQLQEAMFNIERGMNVKDACTRAGFTDRTFYYITNKDFNIYKRYKRALIKQLEPKSIGEWIKQKS